MNFQSTARCAFLTLALVGTDAAVAQVFTTATIQVACGGQPHSNKTPKVAIRWGSPSYSQNEYFSLWQVPCNNQPQTLTGQLPGGKPGFALLNRHSQLEVQTEGAVETHYMFIARIAPVGAEGASFLQIDHAGTPDTQFNNPRIAVTRSAGPNKYGEQNFRVTIPDGAAAHVKIQMSSVNTSRSGRVALRWGHPDFNNSSDFKAPNPQIWTVETAANNGPQPIHELNFDLNEENSELEIQTEGGTDTNYHIALWFDFGSGSPMVPDIEITHGDTLPEVAWGGPVAFNATTGNVYGELNVTVQDSQVVDRPPPTAATAGVSLEPVNQQRRMKSWIYPRTAIYADNSHNKASSGQ